MIRPDFPDELIRFLLLLWLVCSIFAGLCAVCAPPVLEPDFPQADLDSLAEGNFKRDRSVA